MHDDHARDPKARKIDPLATSATAGAVTPAGAHGWGRWWSAFPLTGLMALVVAASVGGCAEGEETTVSGADVPADVGGTGVDVPPTGDAGPDVSAQCDENADCADAFADLGICEQALCTDGTCTRDFLPLDTTCDDGDPCTTGDRCAQDDSGAVVCEPTADCDDDDACNGLETCGESGCVAGDALNCDDNNPCTVDTCDPSSGCEHAIAEGQGGCCEADADCNDGNECTADTCVAGACMLTPVDGSCQTGDACSPQGLCSAGVCQPSPDSSCAHLCTLTGSAGDIIDCPLGLARLGEAGAPATTLAFGVAWPAGAALNSFLDPFCIADDCLNAAIPQTNTSLQPSGHSVTLTPAVPATWDGSVAVNLSHLDDAAAAISPAYYEGDVLSGDPVVFVLRFQLTADVAGEPVLLNSISAEAGDDALVTGFVAAGSAGTSAIGTIVTSLNGCGGVLCFDASPCTEDLCEADTCSYGPAEGSCDDGNPCTIGDTCTEAGGCIGGVDADAGTACTGSNLCAGAGTCDGAGSCVIPTSAAVSCGDSGSPCVELSCDPLTGSCVPGPNVGATCSDGNACTENDACTGDGACEGTAVDCGPGTNCTIAVCDPATGCTSAPSGTPCDDGNPCTTDSCGDAGCEFVPTSGSCDDGNACTWDDTCNANGVCTGSKYPVQDPSCPCVTDAQCAGLDDGNPCNGVMGCVAGTCQVKPGTVAVCPTGQLGCETNFECNPASGFCEGEPVVCDDGDSCTTDLCVAGVGCVFDPMDSCPVGWICQVSGAAGSTVECELRLVRGKLGDAIPSGADVTLHWDPAKLELQNFVDEFCVGANCFPFDVLTCADGGVECSAEDLQPTGHELIVVPHDVSEWSGKVALASYHAGESGKALTSAYKDAAGQVQGDPVILKARFLLKTTIDAGSPENVGVSNLHFNPGSGLEMVVTLEDLNVGRTFVATQP